MRVTSFIAIAAIGLLLCGCQTESANTSAASSPVSYSPASPESLAHLTIRKMVLDDSAAARIALLSRTNSPWNSRSIRYEPADMMHDGPWTTRLYIFTGTDSRHCLAIEARDHANGGVHFEWLNDRMLFVRCWWGRIISTDFVLDTKTSHLVYVQDANYLSQLSP